MIHTRLTADAGPPDSPTTQRGLMAAAVAALAAQEHARRVQEVIADWRRPAAYVVGALMGIVVAAAIVWVVHRG